MTDNLTSAAPAVGDDFTRVHFIGIGGAGMSGIALVLHQRGYQVSGSDLKSSRYTRPLVRAGVDVATGHDAATIDRVNPEVVVISSAIPETNPELMRARELNIPVWPRAKMLSYLSRGAITIAVAGTHGKTTTSSLAATMLERLDQKPTFLIGGVIDGFETNGNNGEGPYFVAEADESDGSFLFMDPNYVIVTNIEADHLDHYGSLEAIEETFCKLMASIPEDGALIVCGEDPHLPELARSCNRRVVTYGFGAENDVVVTLDEQDAGANRFTVKLPAGEQVSMHLDHNPGRHNALNASAVLALGQLLGLEAGACAEAISSFSGVHRRFEHVGEADGRLVIDDYGHHPTEIAATLAAARSLGRRIHVVFQPHRYSRTQSLASQFGPAFAQADEVCVMDVFSAGEMPIPGVSGKTVAAEVAAANPNIPVSYIPNRHELIEHLLDAVEEGEMLITMGAGDVTMVGPAYLEAFEQRKAAECL